MSFSSKSDSEARPLLDDRRSSYGSADSEETTSPETPLNKVSRSDLIWILAGLWSAVFLGALDGTIVATLLTPIGSDFNKANQASYIGTAYLLSVCCFTPLYGRLSDILGRRGAMLLGLFFFGSTGTLLCGLANSMEMLIAARAIAGMGGGGVMTVSSVAVTDLIPLKQRGLYQGMCNILFGLGAGLGGPLGGYLNDAFGWRSAFLLQMPILVFSVLLVTLKVKIKLPFDVQNQSTSAKLKRIDFCGSFTLVGTVGCLLLGFSLKSTEELPWSDPLIWGLFVVSAVFCVSFVLVEHYWSQYPIMPLRLITQRTPLAVSLSNFFGSVGAFSMVQSSPRKSCIYRLTLSYFSAVRLNSSTEAGLHLLPHSVALSTGSVFAGWIMRKTGKLYYLTLASAGSAILASALVCLWNDQSSEFHLWLDIVPQGFGMASLITSTLIAMIAGVVKEDMAVATGITYLFRTTGQVIGVSCSGAILQAVLVAKLRMRIHGPNALEVCINIIEDIRHSVNIIPSLPDDLRTAAISSYRDALEVVFLCQLAMNILTFICCLPIQENPLPCVAF
ncbi:vacuolar amino acid permease [Gloeophyllum trabeum ATCC 11539]|uniref:Vacuolar amino acid permease n=1 Tax=Gloeophyllum trabeum (strain ATCC 11539 / FP-39264 / Madison 617) TaxID=670483 RepID=S7QJS8_GLOTA|nr:vacuolar amino acid permease [Gloeophyllum trabeum ATCC 11539]EPQ59602.1 vacuolar amino acid permease [Gloeophyllum trabeum ATCC 11539]